MPLDAVRAALAHLGKRNLILAIHDVSFPSRPDEEIGRGSPHTRGGGDFARFVAELGFDGLQLGPGGITTRDNPSPYDGTLFSRNPLSLALFDLAHAPEWEGLLTPETLERLVEATPTGSERASHARAFDAVAEAMDEVHARFRAGASEALRADLARFYAEQRDWLEPDALYEVLSQDNRGWHFSTWPNPVDRELVAPRPEWAEAARARRAELLRERAEEIERFALAQFILHRQHRGLRGRMAALGVKLYGDLQVGYSLRDEWRARPLILDGIRLGAPPSRTNPEGQPWGYAVLDPDQYGTRDADGPARAFMRQRIGKLLDELDGIRIDHPHGVVCPWVYDAKDPDPIRAVQSGARLFSSPDRAALARYAIAREAQLDRSLPRHADGWVRALEAEQVEQYALLFDTLVEEARAHGRNVSDLFCEVLSTQPNPLGWVLARHGLGRFRVTQKADISDPFDVYRTENARREDVVMTSTHDTPPLARRMADWRADPATARSHADYLATRLCRPDLVEPLTRDAGLLAQAQAADLFMCDAETVMVFFVDLFGGSDTYNKPGQVSTDNWSLRVPPDYRARYAAALEEGTALDVPFSLALALRARDEPDLARRLEAGSRYARYAPDAP